MTTSEAEAREAIDEQLTAAGWLVQDRNALNLGSALGVAVREFPLQTGFADYLLFVDRKAVGVVEAKPAGTTLSGVAEQSAAYLTGLPANIPHVHLPLPFAYESTGVETFFRDERDPEPRSRRLFAFHRPETLGEWAAEGDQCHTTKANTIAAPSDCPATTTRRPVPTLSPSVSAPENACWARSWMAKCS